jgi:hypothetical protein
MSQPIDVNGLLSPVQLADEAKRAAHYLCKECLRRADDGRGCWCPCHKDYPAKCRCCRVNAPGHDGVYCSQCVSK